MKPSIGFERKVLRSWVIDSAMKKLPGISGNTLSFSKAGKINEVFNLLEIGEVRKGTKGYYVWVREEIEITENNRTAAKTYQWIYQVAPSDTGMKIVNYFPY